MDSEEIKRIRKENNLSQKDLADITGVSIPAVKSWEQNKRNISQSAIKLIETFLANKSTVKYIAPYLGEDLVNVEYVPAKAYASFIESMYSVEYDLETYGVRPEEGEDLTNGKYMVFDIEGDSMYPTIQSGSKILCEKICEGNWEYAKGVVVIVYGKTLTVKRILKNNLYINNILTLKADNPTYGEIDIEKCEIRGVWRAVRVVSMKII
jgi:transcriptional regulator with XRE-family HTH domain